MMTAAAKKLRILHTEASVGWGGQEIRILTEAQYFQGKGHEVLIAANAGSEIIANAPRYGVPTMTLPLTRRSLPSVLAVRRQMNEWRPDVVNPHSSVDSWLVALARIGLHPRPRVVRTRHLSASVPRNFASRWVYNRGADFVMTTGEAIVDALSADGFMPRSRLAAVPTGIDTDIFRPGDKAAARVALGLPLDKFLFGIVATLRSWKGHSYLLDALKRANDPRLHLVIVGDGPQWDNLARQLDDLGIAGRVTMAGRQNDVVPYMQAFDTFVLPSYANEGVPQALLQAMASGLPVIACPIGGIPECTGGLKSVTLVPPKDAAALAKAMTAAFSAATDPAALTRAREQVVTEHSREVMYRKALRHFSGDV
jgi:glycosyltransferase involved in cell wall biosynthesis